MGRDKHGQQVVSDEEVRYLDASDATTALEEVRAAVAQCNPERFHEPGVVGDPATRDQIDVVPGSKLAGLAGDRIALDTTMTTQDGRTAFGVSIYQRRGAILSAVYGGDFDEILPFARLIATRLRRLSPQSAGEAAR